MLTRSEERIFLEAIDQYFESESIADMEMQATNILFESGNIKVEKETESKTDQDKETDIEIMNIKFYEALNNDNNEVKDISTDFESEDNNPNNDKEKIYIRLSDCLILTKESIEDNRKKVFNEYKNQIILEEKIKNLFKKDENEIKQKNINNINSEMKNKK